MRAKYKSFREGSVSEQTVGRSTYLIVNLSGGGFSLKFRKSTLKCVSAEDVHLGEWITYSEKEIPLFKRHYPKIYETGVRLAKRYLQDQ